MKRGEWHDEARKLRKGGLSLRAIASVFGVTAEAVRYATMSEDERGARRDQQRNYQRRCYANDPEYRRRQQGWSRAYAAKKREARHGET